MSTTTTPTAASNSQAGPRTSRFSVKGPVVIIRDRLSKLLTFAKIVHKASGGEMLQATWNVPAMNLLMRGLARDVDSVVAWVQQLVDAHKLTNGQQLVDVTLSLAELIIRNDTDIRCPEQEYRRVISSEMKKVLANPLRSPTQPQLPFHTPADQEVLSKRIFEGHSMELRRHAVLWKALFPVELLQSTTGQCRHSPASHPAIHCSDVTDRSVSESKDYQLLTVHDDLSLLQSQPVGTTTVEQCIKKQRDPLHNASTWVGQGGPNKKQRNLLAAWIVLDFRKRGWNATLSGVKQVGHNGTNLFFPTASHRDHVVACLPWMRCTSDGLIVANSAYQRAVLAAYTPAGTGNQPRLHLTSGPAH